MNIGQNTSRKQMFSDKNAQNTIFHNSHKNKKMYETFLTTTSNNNISNIQVILL